MIKDKTDDYESRVARTIDEMAIEDAKDNLKYPDGNPKTQFGITKPRATYTPPIPYLEYSLAHLQGALKYGPFNWRDDPVTMSTYLDAAESHIAKFRAGQNRATDTDIHELGHAMTCLSIIIDAQAHGTIRDDRWKPRNPANHPWGNNPGKVLDDYIENNQDRVKAIREKWNDFQKRFKDGEVDKAGEPIKKPVNKVSGFQQEMMDNPEKAIGRRGWWKLTGDAASYEVTKVEKDSWLVRNASGEIFKIKFADFIVDSGM